MITPESGGEPRSVHTVEPSTLPEVRDGDNAGLIDVGGQQLKPVGHCIYCDARNDLTNEHIVPFGLSGDLVLPAASCKACAKITSAVERQVLRGPMRAVRIHRGLRSRRKHEGAPPTYALTVVRGGVREVVHLPRDEYPVLLHFPTFPVPRALTGAEGVGIELSGVLTLSFGRSPDQVRDDLGAQEVIVTTAGDQPVAFARMVAKVAYSFAVAMDYDSMLEGTSEVVPAILGQRDDIGHWVGTRTGPITRYAGALHRLAIQRDLERGLLIADIQLFADSESPSYGVILGRLSTAARLVDRDEITARIAAIDRLIAVESSVLAALQANFPDGVGNLPADAIAHAGEQGKAHVGQRLEALRKERRALHVVKNWRDT